MRIFSTGWSEGYDGPGRRWVVYGKGCNLACRWCANPEGISAASQVLFYPRRADGCASACPHGAVNGGSPETIRLDRSICASCALHECTSVRRHPAFEQSGTELSVIEIASQAERYRTLFGKNGGVTFGGGEATLQADELLEAMQILRKNKIHVALETNATSPRLAELAAMADLLICDLKCVASDRHREWTGAGNETILQNLRQIASQRSTMWVRVPVVPGFNDDPQEWESITGFLSDLTLRCPELQVELLPMHHNGEPKYIALDMPYPVAGMALPDASRIKSMRDSLVGQGIRARQGMQVW